MARFLKKTILWILGIFTVILLAVAGTAMWVFHHPKETWAFVQEKFLPKDLKITWQDLQFHAERLSGYDVRVDLGFTDLRIEKQEPALSLPLKDLSLSTSLLFSSKKQKVIVHEARVVANETIRFVPGPEKEPSKPQNPFQTAQKMLDMVHKGQKLVKVENLLVQIPQFELAKKPLVLSVSAEQSAKNEKTDLLEFKISVHQGGDAPFEMKSQGELQLSLLNSDQSFIHGDLDWVGFGVRTHQKLKISYDKEVVVLKTLGPVDYTRGQGRAKTHLMAQPELLVKMDEGGAQVQFKSNFTGIPGPIVRVNQLQADLKTPFDRNVFWSERPSEFKISAPLALFFVDEDMRKPLEKSCRCRIPELLKTEVSGQAWLGTLFSEPKEQKKVADVHLVAESVRNQLLDVNLAADLVAEKKGQEWVFKPSLNSTASIESFQGLRQFLDAKGILIPAPFDALEGKIYFKAQGPVEMSEGSYVFPIVVNTDMASPHQKVRIDTETSMRLREDFTEGFADVKILISDLQLELPPLDPIRGKPRIVLDRRILREPQKAKKSGSKFKMSFAVHAQTAQPGAVRLLSEYFKPYLPLSLDVRHSADATNSGTVRIEPFDIVYLRRTVHLEQLTMDLSQSKSGVLPVDGRFMIRQAEYRVFIDVKGPASKPNIKMSSEPYLPQSEIISVLLYGRTSDELIAADAETAGGVKAAMEDRAIGLFGLWAFASTPIQSFSYNPVTKVYTATLSLADDVTAGVGTNWESATNLELRKRLSKQWVLTAEWVPATAEDDQTTRLVLQWERRF